MEQNERVRYDNLPSDHFRTLVDTLAYRKHNGNYTEALNEMEKICAKVMCDMMDEMKDEEKEKV